MRPSLGRSRSSSSSRSPGAPEYSRRVTQPPFSYSHSPPLVRTGSSDKEHVTIAPIAPTLLKTTGVGNHFVVTDLGGRERTSFTLLLISCMSLPLGTAMHHRGGRTPAVYRTMTFTGARGVDSALALAQAQVPARAVAHVVLLLRSLLPRPFQSHMYRVPRPWRVLWAATMTHMTTLARRLPRKSSAQISLLICDKRTSARTLVLRQVRLVSV
jgi:hypothetical protein